jgi:hypothetical protein
MATMAIFKLTNARLGKLAILIASIFLAGCATSLYLTESVYLTSPVPPETFNDDRYTFIAPYFAKLKTRLNIAISSEKSAIAITSIAVPEERSYLYALKNALFDDTITLKVNSDGLLAESDTTSKQQITSIITTLAQTAAQLTGGPRTVASPVKEEADPATLCKTAFSSLASSNFATSTDSVSIDKRFYPISSGHDVVIGLNLDFPNFMPSQAQTSIPHEGIVVFYPFPAYATLVCTFKGQKITQFNTATQIKLYMDSHFINPKRDFFTNEDHAIFIDAGFFNGQTYKAQSSAKTVVDTITAPARAIMPTVTVNTQVISVPGKPDQITTTTNRTSPKAQ